MHDDHDVAAMHAVMKSVHHVGQGWLPWTHMSRPACIVLLHGCCGSVLQQGWLAYVVRSDYVSDSTSGRPFVRASCTELLFLKFNESPAIFCTII